MHYISEILTYTFLFIAVYFEVFLLITYFENGKSRREEKKAPKILPSVSIMVPCWNEGTTVIATIDSILNLNYPKEKLRVLIVDDGSTDDTWAVLQQFARNPQVTLLQKENGGKHKALNYALQFVETDMVGCLDADSFVNPEALRKIVREFTDEEVMAVTPSIKIHNPKNILELVQKVEYGWGVLFRHILSKLGAIYVTPGPFSIFRREVFIKLGGYKQAHMTEDLELALRLQIAGYKIGNAPDAFVYTVAPKNVKALFKQRLRWTYGFIKNVIDYKQIYFKPRYGNLGMIILPAATLSIFSTLFVTFSTVLNSISGIIHKTTEYSVVGFNWHWPVSFDLFYMNTGIVAILAVVGFMGTLLMLGFSRKMSEGTVRPGLDVLYFLMLYAFLVPLWMSKALYNVAFAKNTSWR
jgi:cellulose synthase/poly-beta-1,6-N-acetylglucosamine synthase-like glycosyltransferase